MLRILPTPLSLPTLLLPQRASWLGCAGLVSLLASSCQPATSQVVPPGPESVLQEWGIFIQTYQHTHDPQVVEKTLAYARATTPAEQQELLSNSGGILGFYQTWLAAHPEARSAFQQQLRNLGGSASWQRFLLSLATPYSGQSAGQGPSPEHNDYLWGSFFATGQPRYLDSLVAQGRFLTARSTSTKQKTLFYNTGRSAIWSLESNAHQDSTVAIYLRNPLVRQRLTNSYTQYQKANH